MYLCMFISNEDSLPQLLLLFS